MAPNSIPKPWYVELVKEIGGLGLVFVMLVGLYLIAKDFVGDMRSTWSDIRQISKTALEEEREDRQAMKSTITTFISEQQSRMTEQAKRMSAIEARIRELEAQ